MIEYISQITAAILAVFACIAAIRIRILKRNYIPLIILSLSLFLEARFTVGDSTPYILRIFRDIACVCVLYFMVNERKSKV